jgi:hypothetical protein
MSVPEIYEIKLACGKVAIVSAADFRRVSGMKWSDNGKGYPRARWPQRMGGHGKIVFLHRFILGAPEGSIVDHINGDPLDNRRENLQFITASRNIMKAKRRPFSGITFDKRARKWRLRLRIDGTLKTLGWYESEDKAKIAVTVAKDIIWSDEFNPERFERHTMSRQHKDSAQ